MSDGFEVAKNIGIIASMIGVVGTAIKTGQWKGEHDARLKALEGVVEKTVDKLSRIDDRVDGIERELLATMAGLKKDIEHIKSSVDEMKNRRREYAAEK